MIILVQKFLRVFSKRKSAIWWYHLRFKQEKKVDFNYNYIQQIDGSLMQYNKKYLICKLIMLDIDKVFQ